MNTSWRRTPKPEMPEPLPDLLRKEILNPGYLKAVNALTKRWIDLRNSASSITGSNSHRLSIGRAVRLGGPVDTDYQIDWSGEKIEYAIMDKPMRCPPELLDKGQELIRDSLKLIAELSPVINMLESAWAMGMPRDDFKRLLPKEGQQVLDTYPSLLENGRQKEPKPAVVNAFIKANEKTIERLETQVAITTLL